MAFSKITITFDQHFESGSLIKFGLKSSSGVELGPYYERYLSNYNPGNAKGYIYINNSSGNSENEADTIITGELAASLYQSKFNYDYNGDSKFNVVRNERILEITFKSEGYTFIDVVTENAQHVISNENSPILINARLNITSDNITASLTQPLINFNLELNTDKNFNYIKINNDSEDLSLSNQFSRDLLRDVKYFIELRRKDANGDFEAYTKYPRTSFLYIPKLTSNNFKIDTSSSLSGSSAKIKLLTSSTVSHEYSVDGVNWQTSTSFHNLPKGQNHLRIRDNYNGNSLGSQISIFFNVTEYSSDKEEIIFISKANALSFKLQQNINNLTVFKNSLNSFDNEFHYNINYCQEALFQNNDTTKIQLKSSFENINVKLRKDDNQEFNIDLNQLTDNISVFKGMDATMIYYTSESIAVYFNGGNIYDSEENIEESYQLNGGLPSFAEVGNTVELKNYGVFKIKETVFLDSVNSQAVIFDVNFKPISATSIIVKSVQTILNYNVFDFTLFWNIYGNGVYDVLITFEDEQFETKHYLSENILIDDIHEGTVAIKYFNDNNRDIFYKYNIHHFIRIPLSNKSMIIQDEVENIITDNSVHLISSIVSEGDLFEFEEMSRDAILKLTIALSCEYVFINGEGYIKSGPFELEDIENTNLNKLIAAMLKTNKNYSNLINEIETNDFGDLDVEIPALFAGNPNFIKF